MGNMASPWEWRGNRLIPFNQFSKLYARNDFSNMTKEFSLFCTFRKSRLIHKGPMATKPSPCHWFKFCFESIQQMYMLEMIWIKDKEISLFLPKGKRLTHMGPIASKPSPWTWFERTDWNQILRIKSVLVLPKDKSHLTHYWSQ